MEGCGERVAPRIRSPNVRMTRCHQPRVVGDPALKGARAGSAGLSAVQAVGRWIGAATTPGLSDEVITKYAKADAVTLLTGRTSSASRFDPKSYPSDVLGI